MGQQDAPLDRRARSYGASIVEYAACTDDRVFPDLYPLAEVNRRVEQIPPRRMPPSDQIAEIIPFSRQAAAHPAFEQVGLHTPVGFQIPYITPIPVKGTALHPHPVFEQQRKEVGRKVKFFPLRDHIDRCG